MILKSGSCYDGIMGDETGMMDSYLNPLFVGDLVQCYYRDDWAKTYKASGEGQGIMPVCKENTDICNMTGRNGAYIMGIADVHNNFDGNYKNRANTINSCLDHDKPIPENLKEMSEWVIIKIKDYSKVVENETWCNVKAVNENL